MDQDVCMCANLVIGHNFLVCAVKALIFSTFCLETCQDKNMPSLMLI